MVNINGEMTGSGAVCLETVQNMFSHWSKETARGVLGQATSRAEPHRRGIRPVQVQNRLAEQGGSGSVDLHSGIVPAGVRMYAGMQLQCRGPVLVNRIRLMHA